MKSALACILLVVVVSVSAAGQSDNGPANVAQDQRTFLEGLKLTMQKYLGRSYVWGATGMKSFDCSGFVWRVLYDNGILMKRTTARKLYMILPPAPKEAEWNFGTLVFFDDLTHVGFVDSPEAFYHSQVRRGTQRSQMTPFWRRKIYGFRLLPTAP
jgi:cell wall-associated NlpC family hydrolase